MIDWLRNIIHECFAPPPEREIGSCVTSQLVEEIERLRKRELEMEAMLRKMRRLATPIVGGGLLVTLLKQDMATLDALLEDCDE